MSDSALPPVGDAAHPDETAGPDDAIPAGPDETAAVHPDDAPAGLAPGTDPEPAPDRPSPRAMTLSVSLMVTALLLAAAVAVPAPYAVQTPGPTVDTLGEQNGTPLIAIDGVETFPSTGELRLTTVSATGGPGFPSTLVAVVRGWLDRWRTVRPAEDLFPSDATRDEIDESNAQQMVSSQENATVAALEELGYDVPTTLTVYAPIPGTGAEGILLAGDVIVAIDGTDLVSYSQLIHVLDATAPGTTVAIGVLRGGERLDVEVVTGVRPATASDPEPSGSLLGVLVDPVFDLPFDVTIQIENIGGSSAGTMFALGIIDRLTAADEANGAVIAGTGTIDAAGRVGPIGGIRQKLAGSARDGAGWFLAPWSNCDEVVGFVPDGLRVVSVATLAEARDAVGAIGAGRGDGLPTCAVPAG